jgi:hypothetical protein
MMQVSNATNAPQMIRVNASQLERHRYACPLGNVCVVQCS